MDRRFFAWIALFMGGCSCSPLSHGLDAGTTSDAPPGPGDAGPDDAPMGLRDAGVPSRWPPLPECPLQPGQVHLPGADTVEGTMARLPGRANTVEVGADVAALLFEEPWRVYEARADRSPLLHAAFEEPATETVPFLTEVSLSVAGDGTIWILRADWRNLDEHGRSRELIGRQIVSIYCGVRTVHVRLDESDLGPGTFPEGGVPIPVPDGATLMEMPTGEVLRFFAGASEPFLPPTESLGPMHTLGGRLFIEVRREEGAPYLVEYTGEPVSAADALLEDVRSISAGRVGLDPLVFCGLDGGVSALLAPSASGADERAVLDMSCPEYLWVERGERWLLRAVPAERAGYYRWDPGEGLELRVPLTEALPDARLIPYSNGGFIIYYASDVSPRYRVRYVDLTQTNELGETDMWSVATSIVVGPTDAHFLDGSSIVWLTETSRIEQPIEGLGLRPAGVAPDGAVWVTSRLRNDVPPNRSRLVRARPDQPPEIVLDEIEEAQFGWLDGFGFGQVQAYDERVDVLGFYAVDDESVLRRLAQTGRYEVELSEMEGRDWFLYDETLGTFRGGALEERLGEVTELDDVVRGVDGQVWISVRRRRADGYWDTRLARVGPDALEVVREIDSFSLYVVDAGAEREFTRAPWGFVVPDTELCMLASPVECLVLPTGFTPAVSASHVFRWGTEGEETVVRASRRTR